MPRIGISRPGGGLGTGGQGETAVLGEYERRVESSREGPPGKLATRLDHPGNPLADPRRAVVSGPRECRAVIQVDPGVEQPDGEGAWLLDPGLERVTCRPQVRRIGLEAANS